MLQKIACFACFLLFVCSLKLEKLIANGLLCYIVCLMFCQHFISIFISFVSFRRRRLLEHSCFEKGLLQLFIWNVFVVFTFLVLCSQLFCFWNRWFLSNILWLSSTKIILFMNSCDLKLMVGKIITAHLILGVWSQDTIQPWL